MKLPIFLYVLGTALAWPAEHHARIIGPPRNVQTKLGGQTPVITPFIIGGEDSAEGEFPYQISLQMKPIFGEQYHICGGIVLDENHVISAAHCVKGQTVSSLEVVAGAQNQKIDEESQQRIKVKTFVLHPDYDQDTISHDYSVLTLMSPLTFNERVQPLPLAAAGIEPSGDCVNTGWGNANPTGELPAIVPDALQKVNLGILDREVCAFSYAGVNEVDESMICASGSGVVGACSGDFGGPLSCTDDSGRAYLAGISSWGMQPCGQARYPNVYSNVAFAREWLLQAASEN